MSHATGLTQVSITLVVPSPQWATQLTPPCVVVVVLAVLVVVVDPQGAVHSLVLHNMWVPQNLSQRAPQFPLHFTGSMQVATTLEVPSPQRATQLTPAWVVVVVLVVVVVVVVDVVGHGVVRGRHLRTYVSRSVSGLVPFAAVAFAESKTLAGCVPFTRGSGIATKLPQAGPSSEPGTAPASLGGLTKSFWSRVGGWQAGRFGSV
jgi:hypothetical protein